ncbi:hypothetical protein GLOTRDRAFT_109688 [Gloeophyllum trabeum ATCC 11539]|uniref:Uncharacterized protein n=1 Tax=Gloeophyllum trabeum (strain ATCC 11539 / FP-39264 / Madison 617) TaxID=670483 RepID=S7QJC9_GLOTA|nr:uncharacterized protein GLOTRDRAFT_109688 [Gloeophyllum trabeum ATCC 11539]EPQ59438.1 hypothetical protein GLOTRDRAFT_109688 [Gloeophyllum trabeum ATCC 11539]
MSVISSSLAPSFSPPPCLHPPSGPLFPRSCNSARGLPFQDTARTCMLKTLLLRRLQSNNLSRSEALSIAPFASKSSEAMKVKSSATSLSEAAVASKRVERFSEGLRRWACRPCFEDRMIVWEPADNAPVIVSKRVSGNGRGYGVASLEFSEGLEALAGLLVDEEPPELSLSPMAMSHSIEDARVPFSTASSDSSHGHPQLNGKSTLPSPLRIEETPSLSAAIHLSLPASSSMPSSPSTAPTSPDSPMPAYPKLSLEPPTVKAKRDSPKPHDASADDLADRIPLGYALRVKKQREQKARFLEEERQRRMSAEKKKLEEERRKHEEEKLQWERERKAWEREKKAMEEEKKQRKLKEEVVAARMRREEERTGARRVSASVVEGEKNEQSRSKRDSSRHRQDKLASDPHLPLPGVARPPSVADSHHRPVSMHSTRGASTEDVRLKDRGRKSSRRQSAASDADSPSTGAPPSTWSMYGMPAVPPMPMMTMSPYGVPSPYMDNMPLLPPNAPFMTQGYGDHRSRSRSGSKDRRDSSQSSRSSSHSRPHSTRSNNNSTERVHQIHGHGSPGATRVASDSHRSHERRPSGGESPNRTSAHRGQLANQGRSYSGSDVERRYSSLRGHASSSSPSTPVRPTMVSSASWGGPWVVQPTMPPSMPMYSGAPAFTAAPIPMMAQGMAQTRSPASHHRQSVIF